METTKSNAPLQEQAEDFLNHALGSLLINGEINPQAMLEILTLSENMKRHLAIILWNSNEMWKLGTIIDLHAHLNTLYADFFRKFPELHNLIKLYVFG